MGVDVCELVRRDHDELDRALQAMTDPCTSAADLVELVSQVRLGLAAHTIADAVVLRSMLQHVDRPHLSQMLLTKIVEHRAQNLALMALTDTEPATTAWYMRALELRILLLDHTTRDHYLLVTFSEELRAETAQGFARDYARARFGALTDLGTDGYPIRNNDVGSGTHRAQR